MFVLIRKWIKFNYFFIFLISILITVLLVFRGSSAQDFGECDFYKDLTPGTVYSFNSPNYNRPYPPGTFCRYTGTKFNAQPFCFLCSINFSVWIVQAPIGNQITLRCAEVNLPYVSTHIVVSWIKFQFVFNCSVNFQSDRCTGDRLQVSRAGNSNLADSERYCSGPFITKSFSQRLVVGEKINTFFHSNWDWI